MGPFPFWCLMVPPFPRRRWHNGPLVFPAESVIIIENFESLQGGVQVPTGGTAHEPFCKVGLVKFQSRRYSPDERRVDMVMSSTSLEERKVDFLRIDEDRKFMARALELAVRGMGHARPNPMVGAVIVKDGRIIGEGWHERFGGPHAEVNAFAHCTEDPAGATLYVTLEPCSHYGKTPPCADLIIEKDIDRVVTAMVDPNPLVSGKGIRRLRDAGIFVTVGVMEKEARKLNEVFLKYVTEHKPFVLYKAAMSLDGKTACHTGDSKWISSEDSREEVHVLRGCYKGIMVGAGTVIADNPLLTARTEGLDDPVRIIVDGNLSVPLKAKVFQEEGDVIVLTTTSSDEKKREELTKLGVDIIMTDGDEKGKVDLDSAMTGLALKGIDGILLEGGATLASSAFEAGIVDKVRIYAAPKIIGGVNAPGLIGGDGASSMKEAVKLKDLSTETCGGDLVIEAYVDKGKKDAADERIDRLEEEVKEGPEAEKEAPAGDGK